MIPLQNKNLLKQACYLNGKWIEDKQRTIAVYNPFDHSLIGHVPDFGRTETQHAIQAADQAHKPWRAALAKERSDLLLKWSHLIEANKEDLSLLMTYEQGKPLAESRGEIDYANGFIRWFAEEGRRVYGEIIPSPKQNQHLFVIKQPIGVVAAITPWNFPAAMITRKVAPALAAGCTVIVKPDQATPFSALALAALAEEAGLPAGVLNIITGKAAEIGAEMSTNSLVRKLSFTGSTAVGRLLMQQCAPTIKKLSLELGGNAPFMIFDDANIDAAIEGLIASKFRNSGQTCVCANRIYVQDRIYDVVTKQLVSAVKKLKLGNGLDAGVQQGPLINEAAVLKVEAHIADAVTQGAILQCGGKRAPLGGLFFEPTVLTDVNASMRIANEETFGPVAPLFRFQTEAEAIQMANATEFGLAAYFYSQQMERIWHVSEALEAGMIGINTGIISTEVAPFGGIKQSGIGREGGKEGIEEYMEMKYLCMSK